MRHGIQTKGHSRMKDPDVAELKQLLKKNIRVQPWEIKPFIKFAVDELKAGRPYGFQESKKIELSQQVRELIDNHMVDFATDLISQLVAQFEFAITHEMHRIMIIALRGYNKDTGELDEKAIQLIQTMREKKVIPSHPLGWSQK